MRITDFKYCSKCNLHKHRDEYAKNAHTRDGLNNWCKKCQWVQRNANGIPAICRQCSKQFMKCKNRRTFCSRACRIASTRKYDPIKLAELAKTGATSTDMAKALGVSTPSLIRALHSSKLYDIWLEKRARETGFSSPRADNAPVFLRGSAHQPELCAINSLLAGWKSVPTASEAKTVSTPFAKSVSPKGTGTNCGA
jgi:hypothetical protein